MSGQTGGEQYFSSVKAGRDPATGRYVSRSRLTQLYQLVPTNTDQLETNEVLLSVATQIVGAGVRIGGTGSVTTGGVQRSLSGGAYDVVGAVPLDQTLVNVAIPSLPSSSVRFFVGTIQGQPEVMRLCWNFDLPGVLRVACTRHRMSDGVQVGLDAGNDLGGVIHTHESQQGKTVEWAPYLCFRDGQQMGVPTSGMMFTQRYYDYSRPYGGIISVPHQYGNVTVTDYGNGRKRTSYGTPFGVDSWFETQEGQGMIRYYSYVAGGTASFSDNCNRFYGTD